MKRKPVWFGGALLVLATAAITGYLTGRARAAIPAAGALTFGGVLTDTGGTPLTGSKNIQITIWDAASSGTQQCATTPVSQTLTAGAFQVTLPDSCVSSIHANPDLWAELFVDGTSVGRTKLGAVPYAVEAAHAASATTADNANLAVLAYTAGTASTASSVPWSGVSGVPINIAGNAGGAIKIGSGNQVLTAGNGSGNLHIDSTNGTTAGAIYLDFYNGGGTVFGNGAAGTVAQIDNGGNFTTQGNVTSSGNITANGMIGGSRGGSGGYIRTRTSGNGVSFDWNGPQSALLFYVEDVYVKNFIISHPTDPDRYLVHTTLEGPENAVFYRGSARLRGGVTEVSLPAYFEAATRSEGRTVLVTPKFESVGEPVSALAASAVKDGAFVVRGIDDRNPEQTFDWEVKAVRADARPLVAEPRRDEIVVHGDGPYRYFTRR